MHLSVGDWSCDGSGYQNTTTVRTSLSLEEINTAIARADERTGLGFATNIAQSTERPLVHYNDLLRSFGCPEDLNHKYVDGAEHYIALLGWYIGLGHEGPVTFESMHMVDLCHHVESDNGQLGTELCRL